MLSKRAGSWKWYDWMILFLVLLFVCPLAAALVGAVAPTSGFAHSMHTSFHAISDFLLLLATGLTSFANFINAL